MLVLVGSIVSFNSHASSIYTYHMNWGLQGGMYNGWFSASYNFSSPINFNYNRKSVLIYN